MPYLEADPAAVGGDQVAGRRGGAADREVRTSQVVDRAAVVAQRPACR